MKKTVERSERKQSQCHINWRFSAPRWGGRRLLSIGVSALLSISTFLTVIPQTQITAYADDSKAIVLVDNGAASNISGAQASGVYFGNYYQSNNTSKEPIKWRVLQNNTTNKTLFLLADKNLDWKKYNDTRTGVTWEISTLRGWLNGLKRTTTPVYDYSNDNFIKSAFTNKEVFALATTAVVNGNNPDYDTPGGNNTNDKVFLLSIAEARNNNLGFTDDNSRKSVNTAYAIAQGATESGGNGIWWLRSPGYSDRNAAYVNYNGIVHTIGILVISTVAVRPAFNLNLSSIILTSAAEGGKISGTAGADALTAVEAYSGSEWKLTVHDTSRDGSGKFTAKRTDRNTLGRGAELKISYSGASRPESGKDNEFVSAIITNDAGTVLYYGHIASTETSASGTATINIPNNANITNTCKLYIFQEQCNGDKETDYSSKLYDLTEPATKETPTADDFDVTPPTDLVYDGSPKTATAAVKSGITGMGTVTVNYYKDGTKLTGAPIDIGTYTVKLDVEEGEGYTSAYGLTKDSWKFTITDSVVAVTGVTVSPKEIELRPGDSRTLTKTIEPDNATNRNVEWTSSKTGVATVDGNGKVTAVDEGDALITVTTEDGGFKATCKVTVKKDAEGKEKIKGDGVTVEKSAKIMQILNSSLSGELKQKVDEAIAAGKEVDFVFDSKDTDDSAPGADKIKSFAKDKGLTMGKFFDLTLYVTVNGGERLGNIEKTDGKVELEVSVPEGLRKSGRTFYVFRNHEGDVSEVGHGRGDSVPISTDSFSTYAMAYKDGAGKDDDDDDDHHHEEIVKPAAVNPDTVEGYFISAGQMVPGVLMCKMKQGPAAQSLFDKIRKAGGWLEAFNFNMAIDGKYEYTLKNGTLTIIIPKEYRKAGRTFALMGLDKNANVVILDDTDTNPDTLTVNLNIEGYAFDLIYRD